MCTINNESKIENIRQKYGSRNEKEQNKASGTLFVFDFCRLRSTGSSIIFKASNIHKSFIHSFLRYGLLTCKFQQIQF